MRTVARLGVGLLTLHLDEADRAELGCFSIGIMTATHMPEVEVRALRSCPASELAEKARRAGLRMWLNPEPRGLEHADEEVAGGGDAAA